MSRPKMALPIVGALTTRGASVRLASTRRCGRTAGQLFETDESQRKDNERWKQIAES